MRVISLVLALIPLLFVQSAWAHAIWIEAAPTGTKGKQHTVRVYYGEYEHAQIEKTTEWYSDLSRLEVYLIQPDQSRTKLALADKGEYLEAQFIPGSEGTYTIYTSHIAKDLWEQKRFQFSSSVAVQVGKKQNQPKQVAAYQLSASPGQYARNNRVDLVLTKQGSPLAGKEVAIMAPKGWVKKLTTDDKGNISFEAGYAGGYVIEFGENVEENGDWDGKPFKDTWQTVTTNIVVR